MIASADLHRTFHALADPSRLLMVERLSRGPASVSDLGTPLHMALPSVLKHLKVLEQGGLVVSRKRGRVRTYELQPRAIAAIDRWVDQRRSSYERSFDRLEQLLDQEQTPAETRRRR